MKIRKLFDRCSGDAFHIINERQVGVTHKFKVLVYF